MNKKQLVKEILRLQNRFSYKVSESNDKYIEIKFRTIIFKKKFTEIHEDLFRIEFNENETINLLHKNKKDYNGGVGEFHIQGKNDGIFLTKTISNIEYMLDYVKNHSNKYFTDNCKKTLKLI